MPTSPRPSVSSQAPVPARVSAEPSSERAAEATNNSLRNAANKNAKSSPPKGQAVLVLDLFGEPQGGTPEQGKSLQSKSLKTLSALMRDIEIARTEIARREKVLASVDERMQREVVPEERKLSDVRLEALRVLGGHLQARWLKKRAARVLYEALCELADELEDDCGYDLSKERVELLGQKLISERDAEAFLDQEDKMFSNPEEFMRAFEELMAGKGARPDSKSGSDRSMGDTGEKGRTGEGERESGSEEDPFAWEEEFLKEKKPRKPKTGKSALKRAEAEQTLAGDIRALYLLLARALHPDKEADPARRDAKTGWMKQVTTAYGERNLARLLDILAQNPMDAVGPYLSQAPVKTVQGFVKRLRRELATLRSQAEAVFNRVPDHFRDILGPNGVNDAWFRSHLGALKREIKFHKQRLESYRTREGCLEFVKLLGRYEWWELV